MYRFPQTGQETQHSVKDIHNASIDTTEKLKKTFSHMKGSKPLYFCSTKRTAAQKRSGACTLMHSTVDRAMRNAMKEDRGRLTVTGVRLVSILHGGCRRLLFLLSVCNATALSDQRREATSNISMARVRILKLLDTSNPQLSFIFLV